MIIVFNIFLNNNNNNNKSIKKIIKKSIGVILCIEIIIKYKCNKYNYIQTISLEFKTNNFNLFIRNFIWQFYLLVNNNFKYTLL